MKTNRITLQTYVKLIKPVKGLPYNIGQRVPVYKGVHGLIWHVWKTIIVLPKDAYERV